MNSVMLVLTLSAGQAPAVPPAGAPMVLPGVTAPGVPVRVQPPGTPPMSMTMPPAGMPPMADGDGKKDGNGDEKKDEEKKEEEKKDEGPPVYALGKTLRETWLGKKMADDGYRLYGWTAMNYTLGTTSTTNLPMTFNDQPNHYQMNQNWLHFEKTIDTTKKEVQWGFVTDSILPGTDYRFTVVRGLFDQQLTQGPNGGPRPYGFDLYQFYGQFFLPDLGGQGTTVKVGRFQTIVGYELVQAVDTPYVSKAYLFQYNAFTHTGVLATTQINDTWSVNYGMSTGTDTFIGAANRATFLGSVKWAPPDGKTTVTFNTVVTNPNFSAAENFAFYDIFELLVTHKVSDKLTYVADGIYSFMNSVPGVGNANWYGLANYFIYKHTDKLASTLRAEVFEDTTGVRTGFKGLYQEFTYGLAYSPCQALILRPSVRYDHNGNSRPFDGDHGMWTAAFEAIVRW